MQHIRMLEICDVAVVAAAGYIELRRSRQQKGVNKSESGAGY